jgi:hypothetical protein
MSVTQSIESKIQKLKNMGITRFACEITIKELEGFLSQLHTLERDARYWRDFKKLQNASICVMSENGGTRDYYGRYWDGDEWVDLYNGNALIAPEYVLGDLLRLENTQSIRRSTRRSNESSRFARTSAR